MLRFFRTIRIGTESAETPAGSGPTEAAAKPEAVSTSAEAGLQSEAGEIKEQARKSWSPGENLLTPGVSAETR